MVIIKDVNYASLGTPSQDSPTGYTSKGSDKANREIRRLKTGEHFVAKRRATTQLAANSQFFLTPAGENLKNAGAIESHPAYLLCPMFPLIVAARIFIDGHIKFFAAGSYDSSPSAIVGLAGTAGRWAHDHQGICRERGTKPYSGWSIADGRSGAKFSKATSLRDIMGHVLTGVVQALLPTCGSSKIISKV